VLICFSASAQQQKGSRIKARKPVPAQRPLPPPDTLTAAPVPEVPDEIKDSTIYAVDTLQMKPSANALKSKVKYTARDSIVYRADLKTIFLYGDAKVVYEDLSLAAELISIQTDKSVVHANGVEDSLGRLTGTPVFTQQQEEFRAQRISYNYKTKRGYLSEFRTKKDEGYIHGTNVRKNEDNELTVKDAYYTTCELDTPHYHINATHLKMIPDKKVIAKWPNLVIEGVNTPLFLPFGIFPIQKGQRSGIVIPTYGQSSDRGFFLRNGGYYFGLGDYMDLMLTGDVYANLSWGSHALFRYANRYHFTGNATFNYASNSYGLPEDPGYDEKKDFQFNWQHMQDAKARPGTGFSANVNLVSNSYLALNSYNTQNIVANQVMSNVNYSRSSSDGRFNLITGATVAQALLYRDITIKLPDVTFTVSSFNPFKSKHKPVADKWYENISAGYSTHFTNQIATKDSTLFRSRSWNDFSRFYDTTGQYGIIHNIPVQTNFKLFKYYALSVRMDMNEYWYLHSVRKDTFGGTVRTSTEGGFQRAFTYRPSAGISTKYYGQANFNGKLQAIRHVITPTIDFSYKPDYSDPSYNYYRSYRNGAGNEIRYSIFERGIVGGPTAGREGNIGVSLDNNLEMKVRTDKDSAEKTKKVQIFEQLRASGFYNLIADSLNLSMIRVIGRTTLFKVIRVNADAEVDPYVNEIDETPDPYANLVVNERLGYVQRTGRRSVRRVNRFNLTEKGSLGLLRSAQLGLNFTFNRDLFRVKKTDRPGVAGELKYINDFPQDYVDFSIPWSLNFNYTVRYDRYGILNDPLASNYLQTLNFNGDFNLTTKWKVGYSSGYDLRAREITYTSIDITRDLHCWVFTFNWIPFGPRQSFLFNINVKSAVLQELKLTRRKDWYDRTI
jgi:hypothetical protein